MPIIKKGTGLRPRNMEPFAACEAVRVCFRRLQSTLYELGTCLSFATTKLHCRIHRTFFVWKSVVDSIASGAFPFKSVWSQAGNLVAVLAGPSAAATLKPGDFGLLLGAGSLAILVSLLGRHVRGSKVATNELELKQALALYCTVPSH